MALRIGILSRIAGARDLWSGRVRVAPLTEPQRNHRTIDTSSHAASDFEAVEFATLEWVDWFNNKRLLEPIGKIPPAEAEARYYAQLDEPAMAA
jgi:transposase InsO family protein